MFEDKQVTCLEYGSEFSHLEYLLKELRFTLPSQFGNLNADFFLMNLVKRGKTPLLFSLALDEDPDDVEFIITFAPSDYHDGENAIDFTSEKGFEGVEVSVSHSMNRGYFIEFCMTHYTTNDEGDLVPLITR